MREAAKSAAKQGQGARGELRGKPLAARGSQQRRPEARLFRQSLPSTIYSADVTQPLKPFQVLKNGSEQVIEKRLHRRRGNTPHDMAATNAGRR